MFPELVIKIAKYINTDDDLFRTICVDRATFDMAMKDPLISAIITVGRLVFLSKEIRVIYHNCKSEYQTDADRVEVVPIYANHHQYVDDYRHNIIPYVFKIGSPKLIKRMVRSDVLFLYGDRTLIVLESLNNLFEQPLSLRLGRLSCLKYTRPISHQKKAKYGKMLIAFVREITNLVRQLIKKQKSIYKFNDFPIRDPKYAANCDIHDILRVLMWHICMSDWPAMLADVLSAPDSIIDGALNMLFIADGMVQLLIDCKYWQILAILTKKYGNIYGRDVENISSNPNYKYNAVYSDDRDWVSKIAQFL